MDKQPEYPEQKPTGNKLPKTTGSKPGSPMNKFNAALRKILSTPKKDIGKK